MAMPWHGSGDKAIWMSWMRLQHWESWEHSRHSMFCLLKVLPVCCRIAQIIKQTEICSLAFGNSKSDCYVSIWYVKLSLNDFSEISIFSHFTWTESGSCPRTRLSISKTLSSGGIIITPATDVSMSPNYEDLVTFGVLLLCLMSGDPDDKSLDFLVRRFHSKCKNAVQWL